MSPLPSSTAVPGSNAQASSLNRDHPWPGLQYFTTADAAYFSGRDGEIDEVCRLIRRHVHTVVFGISGLGKTSLLCAGVIPRLRTENYFPVYLRIRYESDLSPVDQVRSALSSALREYGIDAREPAPGESLWGYFHRTDERFWKGVQICIPVLVFDQFEELFTLGREGPVRQKLANDLIEELRCLIAGRPPAELAQRFESDPHAIGEFDFDRRDFKVVWSLREDFLPDLEGLRDRFHVMGHNRFRIQPLSGEAALNAVLKPGGHLVDREIAAEIVRRVASLRKTGESQALGTGPLSELKVDPALLSLMCFELNLARLERSPRSERIDAELVRNASDRILAEFYQRSVTHLPEAACVFIEERLLTGQGRFRQSAAEEDFLAVNGVTREVLQRLIDGRLLRRDERFGTATIELSHDVLVGPVGEFRRQRRRRAEAAEAEQRRAEAEKELDAQRRELARRRRLNRVLGVASLFLLAALVFAVHQGRIAQRATKIAKENEDRAILGEMLAASNYITATNNAYLAKVEKTNALIQAASALAARRDAELAENAATRSATNAMAQKLIAQRESTNALLALKARTEAEGKAVELLKSAEEAKRDRTLALFKTSLDSAITLARVGDFGAALDALGPVQLKGEADTTNSAPFRSSLNLMTWFAKFMSATAVQTNFQAPTSLHDVAITPNGARLAVIGENGSAYVFDLHPTQFLRQLTNAVSGVGNAVLLDPLGTWVITGGEDQRVIRWSVGTGEIMSEMRATAPVVAMALEGGWLAVGSNDGVVSVGHPTPELQFSPLRGNVTNLTSVALAPGGHLLAAGSSDGFIRLWSLPDATSRRRADARPLPGITNRQARIRTLALDPSGEIIAAGGADGMIYLHSVKDGTLIRTLRGHQNRVSGLSFLTDPMSGTNYLLSASWDRALRLWDINTGTMFRSLAGHTAAVNGLVTAGTNCFSIGMDKTWREWHPWKQDSLQLVKTATSTDDPPISVALAPDGSRFAVGTKAGQVMTYPTGRTQSKELWRQPNAHAGPVNRLGFKTDSSLVSVGSDRRTRRWGPTGAALAPTIPASPGPLNSVAVSGPNGTFAIAGLGGSVRLTNAPDQLIPENLQGAVTLFDSANVMTRTFRAHSGEVRCVAFGPGATELISVGDDADPKAQVLRWSLGGGHLESRPVVTGLDGDVYWAVVSPNGHWIASGGRDAVLSLARADGSTPPIQLIGHENAIVRVAFSPDSAQIFTAGTDGTVRAWKTGEERTPAEPRELFTLRLPYTDEASVPLWDFDFLGQDAHGNSWLAVPLTSGYVACYSLGPIYSK